MFQLTTEEAASLRCQTGILKTGRGQHRKYLPHAFTEEGAAMLLKPAGTQRSFEPAEIFRQFSGPAQALAGLLGMFEGEDFGVQGLPREIDPRVCDVRFAKSRVVGAVADQG